jgi:predicted DCC family thiol-disulfide oxidoreductase YuxK
VDSRSASGAAAVADQRTPILLYDGACPLCANSVRLILRHERQRTLRFGSLQGLAGTAVRARHPELDGVNSMVWVEPAADGGQDRLLVRSDAALEVASYLGGFWRLAASARLLPRVVRDTAYDLVARHRHLLSGPADRCVRPSAADRHRFLE